MKRTQIGSKSLYKHDYIDRVVWYSYNTAVAVRMVEGSTLYVTKKKYSHTTTKHCNLIVKQYAAIHDIVHTDQVNIDALAKVTE